MLLSFGVKSEKKKTYKLTNTYKMNKMCRLIIYINFKGTCIMIFIINTSEGRGWIKLLVFRNLRLITMYQQIAIK